MWTNVLVILSPPPLFWQFAFLLVIAALVAVALIALRGKLSTKKHNREGLRDEGTVSKRETNVMLDDACN